MRFEGKTLSTEHSRISKGETKSKEKEPETLSNSHFQQPRSGSLSVQTEQLEIHLRRTYSDPEQKF